VQGGECFFCRKQLSETDASIEHLLAKSNGGGNQDENCVACCKSLNALLGSMSVKQKFQTVLNQKGQFRCPNGVQQTVAKTDKVSPKAAKLFGERCEQVITNLNGRGIAKPATITKLKSTIAALFQPKLRPEYVDALVQELQSRRVILVSGSKVSYS
jgi:hypothetical protein